MTLNETAIKIARLESYITRMYFRKANMHSAEYQVIYQHKIETARKMIFNLRTL